MENKLFERAIKRMKSDISSLSFLFFFVGVNVQNILLSVIFFKYFPYWILLLLVSLLAGNIIMIWLCWKRSKEFLNAFIC